MNRLVSRFWPDPAEQLADMRDCWARVRRALDSDRQYRQARTDVCDALLFEAESYIRQAASVIDHNPSLQGGDSFLAFKSCLRVAFRDLQLACRDPAVVIGTGEWERQVERGHKGAAKRWGKRDGINKLYRDYAKRRDVLGLAPPRDIYESFAGDCREQGIEVPTEKRFSDRLAEVRRELKLK